MPWQQRPHPCRWLHLKCLSHQALGQGLIMAWPAGPILPIPFGGGLVFSPPSTSGKSQIPPGVFMERLSGRFFLICQEAHEYIPALTNYSGLMQNFKRGMRPIYLFVFPASWQYYPARRWQGGIISVFHRQSGFGHKTHQQSILYWLMVALAALGNTTIIMHRFHTAHNKIVAPWFLSPSRVS